MKIVKKIQLNVKNKMLLSLNHAKKSYNHCAHGDYNVELLYLPLNIILKIFIV